MLAFLMLTFAWSWGVAYAVYAMKLVPIPFTPSSAGATTLFLIVFMSGPAVAALVMSATEGGMKEKLRFRILPNVWWILAWAIPIALIVAAQLTTLGVPGVSYVPPHQALAPAMIQAEKTLGVTPIQFDYLVLFQALVVGALINMFGTLTEELGWRGYMLYRLIGHTFWTRHLIIGFAWGIWHAPVIAMGHNYPGEPVLGIGFFLIFCMLASPIIGMAAERGRSVLAAGLFHGTLNAAAPLSVLTIAGAGVFERGIVGWPGLVVMALSCAAISALGLDRKAHPE